MFSKFTKSSINIQKFSFLLSFGVLLFVIIIGFAIIGTPGKARLVKLDELNRENIASLAREIAAVSYRAEEKNLVVPANLEGISLQNAKNNYVYKAVSDSDFKICETFNSKFVDPYPDYSGYVYSGSNLRHDTGYQCFEFRVIVTEGSAPGFPELKLLNVSGR